MALPRPPLSLIVVILSACTVIAPENKNDGPKWVMDHADILREAEEDSISALATRLEKVVGSQIVVLTVDSLAGEKIEEFSLRNAETLGIGRATHNDGILITVAVNDRKVRIEVGEGLERIIRDEIAAALIREELVPRFHENKFGEGLISAVKRIDLLIRESPDLVGKMNGYNSDEK